MMAAIIIRQHTIRPVTTITPIRRPTMNTGRRTRGLQYAPAPAITTLTVHAITAAPFTGTGTNCDASSDNACDKGTKIFTSVVATALSAVAEDTTSANQSVVAASPLNLF